VSALRALLARHRIRRLTGEEVHAALPPPPPRPAAVSTVAIAHEQVVRLVPRLQLLHEQRTRCRQRLKRLLAQVAEPPGERREHRDVTILRS
jgi:transposase